MKSVDAFVSTEDTSPFPDADLAHAKRAVFSAFPIQAHICESVYVGKSKHFCLSFKLGMQYLVKSVNLVLPLSFNVT